MARCDYLCKATAYFCFASARHATPCVVQQPLFSALPNARCPGLVCSSRLKERSAPDIYFPPVDLSSGARTQAGRGCGGSTTLSGGFQSGCTTVAFAGPLTIESAW